MAALDDIIHQPLRLQIMAALNALPSAAAGLEFSRLKKLTGATDGNLGNRDRGRSHRLRPPCRHVAGNHRGLGKVSHIPSVIPGLAKREPGIHQAASPAGKWIPGSLASLPPRKDGCGC
jgi:hypothetical protein